MGFILIALSPASPAQQSSADLQAQLLDELSRLTTEVGSQLGEGEEKSQFQRRLTVAETVLQQWRADQQEIERLSDETGNAETTSQRLASQVEQAKSSKDEFDLPASRELPNLETKQSQIQTEINRLQAELSKLDSNLSNVVQENQKLDQELSGVDGQIEGAEIAKERSPSSGDAIRDRFENFELELNLHRLKQRRLLLQAQQAYSIANEKFDLDRQRRELAWLLLQQAENSKGAIADAIAKLRQKEARDLADKATEMASEIRKKYPELATCEQATVAIVDRVQVLELEYADSDLENRDLEQQFVDVHRKFIDTKTRIGSLGPSTVGMMLRKRRSELPSIQQIQQQAVASRDRIETIQDERFKISERLETISESRIRLEIEDAGFSLTDADWQRLEAPIAQVVERREESLLSLHKILDRLFKNHLDIETNNSRLARVVDQFSEYINERILWLRSNKFLFAEREIDQADGDLFSVEKWQAVKDPIRLAVEKRPWSFGIVGLLAIALFVVRPAMRQRVDELGETAGRGSCATFWPTVWAAIGTTLIAITLPIVVIGVGWGFRVITPTGNSLFDAMAHAMVTAGLFALPVEILRRACRPNGLATKHFDWSDDAVEKLQANLSWYVLPATLLVFAVSLLIKLDTEHRVDLMERVLYVIAMLLTVRLFQRVFSPANGIFSRYLRQNGESWSYQTSSLWFTLILIVPVALALLAIAGYYYTAVNLTRCLCFTFAFAVAVELTRALIRRFVLVRRRSAHIETAKRKRVAEIEAHKEARKKAAAERERRIKAGEDVEENTTPVMTTESLAELQFENIDIDQNAGQANQLIMLLGWTVWLLGLWTIWSDVLPAMKALDDYKLWGSSTVAVESKSNELSMLSPLPTDVSGESENATDDRDSQGSGDDVATDESPSNSYDMPLISLDPPKDDRVSIRDFLVFIAIVLLTFFAARNLPNAFEMLFLEELPVDRSARFASKALFSYAIVILGTVLALRTLSINWTSIQWLVTALTFGLAFGLQEIFANFVAGIILMFERPMRIGDLITVDEFTGVVTRIRTRATTIVNWDRKEYIIPNKDFITGRLINWTLSDAINRIQFTVGIAYGSDVAKAKKIIFDICREHPSIVDDPATSITFEEFADSSLNLVVRTFLGEVDSRLGVIDNLHSRINSEFSAAGIEIAFPQHDLNLKYLDEDVARALAHLNSKKSNTA